MGYPEHECDGCKDVHGAGFWYTRDGKYLCGEKFNKLTKKEKVAWSSLEPEGPRLKSRQKGAA